MAIPLQSALLIDIGFVRATCLPASSATRPIRVIGNGQAGVNVVDIPVHQPRLEICVACFDPEIISDGVALFLVAPAAGVAMGVSMLLPEHDAFRSEAQTADGDVDSLFAHSELNGSEPRRSRLRAATGTAMRAIHPPGAQVSTQNSATCAPAEFAPEFHATSPLEDCDVEHLTRARQRRATRPLEHRGQLPREADGDDESFERELLARISAASVQAGVRLSSEGKPLVARPAPGRADRKPIVPDSRCSELRGLFNARTAARARRRPARQDLVHDKALEAHDAKSVQCEIQSSRPSQSPTA